MNTTNIVSDMCHPPIRNEKKVPKMVKPNNNFSMINTSYGVKFGQQKKPHPSWI